MTGVAPRAGSVLRLIARASERGLVDLFVITLDGEVRHKVLGVDAGQPWRSLDYQRFDDVPETAGQRFAVGQEGHLQYLAPDRSDWDDLGGCVIGGEDHVAVLATGHERVDLFAIWAGAAIVRRSFDGEWSPWELIDILEAVGPYTVLRPRDLVSLTVRSSGLRAQASASGTPELVADGDQGRLVVDFPPQHIAETVITSTTSSAARLAGPSSLHFLVTSQHVALSAEGVLRAMADLPLAVTPRVQGQSSALELPWRLLLALQANARCVHRQTPSSSADGVTELWHTRLMRSARAYAAVYPFASLPLELPFADGTPLGRNVATIAAQGASHPDLSVAVDRLILGACGAWFSGSASWPDLDWTHKTAMARDYYVRVVTRGLLFPFGHRAAVVETTERAFEQAPPVAGLRKTWSLVITEPSRDYGISAPHERAFPFQRVEIEPRLLTPVDKPPEGASAFWPKRGGEPVLFAIRAFAGSEIIEMALPLLFSDGTRPELLDGIFERGPRSTESTASFTDRPTALVRRFMPLAMKNQQEALEGATQQVRSLTFGGAMLADGLGFHPRITQLEVELPAVNQLLGAIAPFKARLASELLQSTPASPPDVLLEFDPRALNFGSAKAGVVAAPTLAVNRISRMLGPTVASLPTNPADLFGPQATLLGIVPLSAIIGGLDRPPTITWTGGANPTAIMKWRQTLSKERQPFIPRAGCAVELEVKSTVGADGRPMASTRGVVTSFALNIPPGPKPLVVIEISELTFHVETGGLPKASFKITSASLGGGLKFVQKLSEHLPKIGNSGPKVDVTVEQIKVAYTIAIPTPVGIGVFTLQNLLLQAGVTLSFVNQPITIDFAFGTRANPFLVTVTGFGGGGYLELGIGAGGPDGGLQRFVGGIEFGASVAMNFGVASGEVHVFGGVVFTKRGAAIEIAGYLRIGGMVRVLGLISVSIELTVSLTYVEPNELRGAAKLVITVDLTFWSTSVEIHCEKSFSGSSLTLAGGPPDLLAAPGSSVEDALGPVGSSFPWQTYCRAFAGE